MAAVGGAQQPVADDGWKEKHFDYLVIGGGSAGCSSARRAAAYGAKVCLVESAGKLGGTCVNVGCVPKKIMFNAASLLEASHGLRAFCFEGEAVDKIESAELNWGKMREKRDKYIERLNGIYARMQGKSGVEVVLGTAAFTGPKSVSVAETGQTITADHVLIGVGGYPRPLPAECPGAALAIDSDGFFEISSTPKKVAVIGAGYIACEMAGIFSALGIEVHLFVRSGVMGSFDPMLRQELKAAMRKSGMKVYCNTKLHGIEAEVEGATAFEGAKKIKFGPSGRTAPGTDDEEPLKEGEEGGFDIVLAAIGRNPHTERLGLDKAGVEMLESGHIKVDADSNTSASGVYAVGDVIGKADLTPAAIMAGRVLADRLFGPKPRAERKPDYEAIPTAVFTHPPMGACGLTEPEAEAKYGKESLTVYKSRFTNLYYAPYDHLEPADKPKTAMKVICSGPEERVVGIHMIGMAVDEILQGFGVAMKMGCTKADLDRCVAIHPTAAEELVTMAPWGGSKHDD